MAMVSLEGHDLQTLKLYIGAVKVNNNNDMHKVLAEIVHNDERIVPYEMYRLLACCANRIGIECVEGVRDWCNFFLSKHEWERKRNYSRVFIGDNPVFELEDKNEAYGYPNDAVMPPLAEDIAWAYSIFAKVHPTERNEHGCFYMKTYPDDPKYGVAFCVPMERRGVTSSQTYAVNPVDVMPDGRKRLMDAVYFMYKGTYNSDSPRFGAYSEDCRTFRCRDGEVSKVAF